MKLSVLVLLALAIVAPASAAMVNTSTVYVLDQSATTPFTVWAGAIVLGGALLVLSLWHFPGGEEDFVSVLSWFPLGFAMFTSFAVDTGTGTGVGVSDAGEIIAVDVHQVHSYWPIAIALFVILVFAIANTYRIVTNARKESLPRQVPDEGGAPE
jgi:hypothetical protein